MTSIVGSPWIPYNKETSIINLSSPSSSTRTKIWLNTSNNSNLDTGGAIWHAALCLSIYILDNAHIVKGKHVLELGSGCGLVGLVAAAAGSVLAVYNNEKCARSVTMTDISDQIDHLKANVDLNTTKRVFDDESHDLYSSCSISCIPLLFGSTMIHPPITIKDKESTEFAKFDVILGSDIGFDVSLQSLLAKSLYGLANEFTVMLIAEEIRWKDIYAWFKDSLDEVGVEAEDEIVLYNPSKTHFTDTVKCSHDENIARSESSFSCSKVTSSCQINLLQLRKKL